MSPARGYRRRPAYVAAVTLLLAVYWAWAFLMTHLPPTAAPRVPHGSDKVAHFVGYFVLAFILHRVLRAREVRRATVWTFAICLIYGVIDETTQPLVGRSADVYDWLADGAGTVGGILAALGWDTLRTRLRGRVSRRTLRA